MSVGDNSIADSITSTPTLRLDAHTRPPDNLRLAFKKWQKSSQVSLTSSPDLIDTISPSSDDRLKEQVVSDHDVMRFEDACRLFMADKTSPVSRSKIQCFEIKTLPGLFIYPSLYSSELQIALLEKMLHRDLSNPDHKTNLHLHYHMPGKNATDALSDSHPSLFKLDPRSVVEPQDALVHRPLTIAQVLEKKLRWITLGGQYDWTRKVYPDEEPPAFPPDIADLLRGAFPSVDPQAAILNLYSPGDTLSLHRDVSEDCDRGLISLSIGCDAIFMLANTNGSEIATIRLRSGDVILMSSESRYAWHAVPKVISDTCPEQLRLWPATQVNSEYNKWHNWLANKRINLNVRQMREELSRASVF